MQGSSKLKINNLQDQRFLCMLCWTNIRSWDMIALQGKGIWEHIQISPAVENFNSSNTNLCKSGREQNGLLGHHGQ